jgi:Cu/Ag efflux pump CusA
VIRGSLRFRLLVLAAAAILLIVGTVQVRETPVDVLPEFTAPSVTVQIESLGLSAEEVEQLITVPLEQDILNGVRGARTIRSDSVPGMSQVYLGFDHGENQLEARQLTQERLTQAGVGLPHVSRPAQMLDPVSSTRHVMIVGLSTRKLTPIQLGVLARWTITPRLRGIDGVSNVAIWGFRDRQLQVLVDPQRLRKHGLTVQQIVRTTGNAQLVSPLSFLEASTPGTGGFIDGPNQRLSVRHVLPFGKPSNLAQIPIEGRGGHGLQLGDVAKVVEGHQEPLIGDAVVHGGPGLLLVIDKQPSANTLAVTRRIDDALSELQPGTPGVSYDRKVFRPASYIEDAQANLLLILLAAGALALLALVAFLRRWHAVLIGAVAIPVSFVAALLVLHFTGGTLNALALAGLAMALGVVVDDAVSDSRSIAARLRERRAAAATGAMPPESRATLVLEAATELRSPLAYATLIVLLVAVPVLVSRGLTAAFVHPMALSFVLAVIASMVVAVTVTPALALLLAARAESPPRPSALGRRISASYGRVLARVVRAPSVALIVVAVVGIGCVAIATAAMSPSVPSFKERNLLVRLNATPGTALGEMTRITRNTAAVVRALPGVRDVGASVGRAITGDRPVGSGSSELWVSMDDSADYDRTRAAIRNAISHTPGLGAALTTYEADTSSAVLKGGKDAVTVRVFGQDYDTLARQAGKLAQTLSGIDGVIRPAVDHPVQQPAVQIKVDLAAALRHGIKPGDVRRAAAVVVSGITVGNFFEQQKVFDVVVRGIPSTHRSVADVRNLVIDKPGGGHVRLRDVADVTVTHTPVNIRHEDVSRYVDISLPVSGRSLGAVARDARGRIADFPMPLEYNAQVLGSDTEPHTTPGGFVLYLIAAFAGVFLLLQAAFRSWTLGALAFLLLPAALVGGVLVALVTGNQDSLGALAGLVAVFAIAARHAVVVVRRLQRLEDVDRPVHHADVLVAMRERVEPVLGSVLAMAVAFLPFAIAGDIAGNEITYAMALVVLGGLVTSTLLTIFVLPATYLRFAGGERTADRRLWRPERFDPRSRLGSISRRGRHVEE